MKGFGKCKDGRHWYGEISNQTEDCLSINSDRVDGTLGNFLPHYTEKREEKLQTSVPCLCYCFLVEYLALAGLMNFLAQLSDKIHHFTVYNLMPLAFLTKLSKMH